MSFCDELTQSALSHSYHF